MCHTRRTPACFESARRYFVRQVVRALRMHNNSSRYSSSKNFQRQIYSFNKKIRTTARDFFDDLIFDEPRNCNNFSILFKPQTLFLLCGQIEKPSDQNH